MGNGLEVLTENLFKRISKEDKNDPLYYLDNNNDDLDKSYYVVSEYYNKKYCMYKKDKGFEIKRIKGNKWCLCDKEIEIRGETLNSFSKVKTKYNAAIEDNGLFDCSKKYEDKKYKYPFAYLYFYLMTTIGNLMPCMKGFNYNPGGKIDIVQDKVAGYIWISYGGEEKKISSFIKKHYLKDFVEEKGGKVKAIQFIDTTSENGIYSDNYKKLLKEEKEKIWNLFFYRTARVIMKRSYRILKEIDGDFSPEQKKEFNDAFIKFSGEFGINI